MNSDFYSTTQLVAANMTTYEYSAPSLRLIDNAELLKQGAEAVRRRATSPSFSNPIFSQPLVGSNQANEQRVYAIPTLLPAPTVYYPPSHPSTSSPSPSTSAPTPAILKHRFPKTYRHPALDASLTKTRLQFEARALSRCAKAGVTVPRVLWVDEPGGTLAMELVEGWSVREVLGGGAAGEVEVGAGDEVERDADDAPVEKEKEAKEDEGEEESQGLAALRPLGGVPALMTAVGAALARLHHTAIIHGDLTTSNMMVRLTPNGATPYEIVSRLCVNQCQNLASSPCGNSYGAGICAGRSM